MDGDCFKSAVFYALSSIFRTQVMVLVLPNPEPFLKSIINPSLDTDF